MRQYLPTLADLIDRLSIVILKSVFIPEHKKEYDVEQDLIMNDIGEILTEWGKTVTPQIIRATLIVMLANRYIWENEARARMGEWGRDSFLYATHSINGVRNQAKNVIASEVGERIDFKIDALAAQLPPEFGDWNLFHKSTTEWTGPRQI